LRWSACAHRRREPALADSSARRRAEHIEHIYVKVDASARATASLLAVAHGLLPEEELVA
jgi:hypothetical protein